MTTKTEEQWDERFGPTVDSSNEATVWQDDDEGIEEILRSQPGHVWSVVEGDDGSLYLSPGVHPVNFLGYVISTEAITDEEIASDEWGEVLWLDEAQVARLAR